MSQDSKNEETHENIVATEYLVPVVPDLQLERLMEGVRDGAYIPGINCHCDGSGRNGKGIGTGGIPRNRSVSGFGHDDADDDDNPSLNDKNTLQDVGGLDDHIKYLQRAVIFPMKNKEAFKQWGITPPKGIIFHGPPGTGKTLLAQALANDIEDAVGAPVSFYYVKGCELHSKWFGETEEHLRNLFQKAKQTSPSVIFFDEIDGLCPNRDTAARVSEGYVGIVTAMLGLIDSVSRGEIFLIGATNRLESVDPAILRPGRFDKEFSFPLPDHDGRKDIIRIHTQRWRKDTSRPTDNLLEVLANRTMGFTGADLAKLCTEALQMSVSRHKGRNLTVRVSPDQIQVVEDDWLAALASMNCSPPDVFGSATFVAASRRSAIDPLVKNVVCDIVSKLLPLIPLELGEKQFRNNFMIWDDNTCDSRFFHHEIMHRVLGNCRINKTTIKLLDYYTVIKRISPAITPIKVMMNIVNSCAKSPKPSILYVPEVENLLNFTKPEFNKPGADEGEVFTKAGHLMLKIFAPLQSSRCVLVGTHFSAMKCCPEWISRIFSQDCAVKKQNADEICRQQFFRQLFDAEIEDEEQGEGEAPACKRARKDTILTRLVEKSENKSYGSIEKLYSTLAKAIKGQPSENNVEIMENVLNNYEF